MEERAYDFALFEEASEIEEVKVENKPQIKEHKISKSRIEQLRAEKARRKKIRTWAVVISLMMFAGVFILNANVECYKLDLEYNEKTIALAELESEFTRLNNDNESKQSREFIENYAVNVLNMQKVQDYQRKTVTLDRNDTIVDLQ